MTDDEIREALRSLMPFLRNRLEDIDRIHGTPYNKEPYTRYKRFNVTKEIYKLYDDVLAESMNGKRIYRRNRTLKRLKRDITEEFGEDNTFSTDVKDLETIYTSLQEAKRKRILQEKITALNGTFNNGDSNQVLQNKIDKLLSNNKENNDSG